jgi:hypothetical protein
VLAAKRSADLLRGRARGPTGGRKTTGGVRISIRGTRQAAQFQIIH